mmetsp:Transcript_20035/g.61721  ORF Transcript_20035/g.61721 Transcript_20035/m.61721 type:complete len:218 (-) Transcript_20035:145-798(-)
MPSDACASTHRRASSSKPARSPPRMRLPASQLRGESAFGAASSARTAVHADASVQAGDHASFRMSRQTSPVRPWTFGWKTGVTKRSDGGASGYCAGTVNASSKTPPANGVSSGPATCAVHVVSVSGSGVSMSAGSVDVRASALSLRRRLSIFAVRSRTRRAAGRARAALGGTPRGSTGRAQLLVYQLGSASRRTREAHGSPRRQPKRVQGEDKNLAS